MTDFFQTYRAPLIEDLSVLEDRIARWLDDYREEGGKIFCGAGCSNCCTLYVDVSFSEALLIFESLDTRQSKQVLDAFDILCAEVAPVTDQLGRFRKYRDAVGFCPLLSQHCDCSVYVVRPAPCRALLSTRPPVWCNVDFANLDPLDRRLFLESLDRNVVAMPTHYVAATQQLASFRTEEADRRMFEACGFAIRGNLVGLLGLLLSLGLEECIAKGEKGVADLLSETGLGQNGIVHFVEPVPVIPSF